MCRLVAYLGQELLLATALVKPKNSLISQSLSARESSTPTNGDGFGLGWYVPSIAPEPALFTSVQPAWNDRNLLNLTNKIKAPCFFAHIRAASSGGVSQYNCHPFVQGKWMMMHNGEINNFILIKRHLRRLLADDVYHAIQGETDSEHFFALMIQLSKGRDLSRLSTVGDIIQETIYRVLELVSQYGGSGPSYFNICLTDGKRLWATRYCSDKNIIPESLHYSVGDKFQATEGRYHMLHEDKRPNCILVTSEELTNCTGDWQIVPSNHLLMVNKEKKLYLRPL